MLPCATEVIQILIDSSICHNSLEMKNEVFMMKQVTFMFNLAS